MNNALREVLGALLAFDTTSRESNLALIGWVESYLAAFGLYGERYYDASGHKANLLVRLGPPGPGGVLLAGHTDVVPVDGQVWSVPPFALTERDGRCYGRGSADMKGFLACVLAAVPELVARPLTTPLYLAFSYDEEVGCLGVHSLIDDLRRRPERPEWCIIGEPTDMRPVYGHKGKVALRCTLHGHACHSAYAPDGVNAIEYAARLIGRLVEMGEALKQTTDPRFDPPFTTLQVGTISGGSALNIVPQQCQFDMEIRHLPATPVDELVGEIENYAERVLLPAMQQVAPASRIDWQPLSRYPGLLTDGQIPFARWLSAWCGSEDFHTVAFGTEGGLFADAGIATLVCGPGSMDQGHKPDEYVTCDQLTRCQAMLHQLTVWLQRPAL